MSGTSSADGQRDQAPLIAAAQAEFDSLRARGARHQPRADSSATVASSLVSLEGNAPQLPGYQISEFVSRGGQGAVFRATQLNTGREVAVKVIWAPPERDRRTVSRFEREVQILGRLDHPSIVGVLDSGSTSDCLYCVMDYVRGMALDAYFRAHNTALPERVDVLAKICDALHIAHLHGVIHRDVKPANIRVDTAGDPHLLDFGLAKEAAVDREGASHIAHTATGEFVGSLPWASPEQVSREPDRLDIRTDIYSIGVVLYQVLADRLPYSVMGPLPTAIQRICDEDPPKPSKFNRAINDELDAIVMRCLRKRPDDRYQSAGELARDLRSYRAGEPVMARSDSGWYLLRKTLRRNRGAVTAAGVGLLVACYSFGLLGYLYQRESALLDETEAALTASERHRKSAVGIAEFLTDDLLAAVSPAERGRDVTMREVLDAASASLESRFQDEPELKARIHVTLGKTYRSLGEIQSAVAHTEQALEHCTDALGREHLDTQEIVQELAAAYGDAGRLAESQELAQEVLTRRERALGPDHERTIAIRHNVGWSLFQLDRREEAEAILRQNLDACRRVLGNFHASTQNNANSLAVVLTRLDKPEEAEKLQREAINIARVLQGPSHVDVVQGTANLAVMLWEQGRLEEAEAMLRETMELRRELLGPAHPRTLTTINNLATLSAVQKKNDQAIALYEEIIRCGDPTLPIVIGATSNLAQMYCRTDRWAESLPYHRDAVRRAREVYPPEHSDLTLFIKRFGFCLAYLDQYEEAEPLLLEAYPALLKYRPPDFYDCRECADALVWCCKSRGDDAGAAYWQERGNPPQSSADEANGNND
jgi:tetratricopeptide (TPR) repeat protein